MTFKALQFPSVEAVQLPSRPLHLAIGMFDGVHLGHRAVIEAAVHSARRSGGLAAVLTFHPHPSELFQPNNPAKLILSLPVKTRLLLGLGVDVFAGVCVAPEAPDQPMVYRKPSPRFAQEMAAKYDLDLAKSWMVGDYPADVETAFAAGMQAAALPGEKLGAEQIDHWRSTGREVILYPSLAALVDTLKQA